MQLIGYANGKFKRDRVRAVGYVAAMIRTCLILVTILLSGTAVLASFPRGFESPNPKIDLSGPWALLKAFFKGDMPSSIEVEFKDFPNGYSKFNCPTKTVFINSKVTHQKLIQSLVLMALGNTKSFSETTETIYQPSESQMLDAWVKYLTKVRD